MNALRKLRYAEFNSGFARALLSLVYKEGGVYRIPMGPLRGVRLYYDRSVNFHAILGLWDLSGFDLLRKVLVDARLLKENAVVADVGANLGLVSLWLSGLLGGKGRIHAFEPAPEALVMLRRNLLANQVKNVVVEPVACSDRIGEVDFFVGPHHHCSSFLQAWASEGGKATMKITVPTVTLDSFFYGETPREGPDFIKVDIEGGAVFALKGCDRCVEMKQPLFYIESHTPDEDRVIGELAVRHGYSAYRVTNRRWVKNLKSTHPDPDGIWGTLLLCPPALKSALEKVLGT